MTTSDGSWDYMVLGPTPIDPVTCEPLPDPDQRARPSTENRECADCGGYGDVPGWPDGTVDYDEGPTMVECPNCDGTGEE